MSDGTGIEWANATWNPITGCSVTSPGCTNCYAMRLAGTRLRHHPSRKGLTQQGKAGPVWTGEVRFNEEWLDQPLRWRRPRRIFVCAHGDLFHESVPDEWIDRVFAIMALAPQHTFQVLTKRSARMREYLFGCDWFCGPREPGRVASNAALLAKQLGLRNVRLEARWPLPNVWLGVSVEDQARADERIPDLLATPAAVRFISAEPLLGPVDLRSICDGWSFWGPLGGRRWFDGDGEGPAYSEPCPKLDWVIAGGESGPNARPMHPDWARSLRDQCQAAGVPFFFKQWGEWEPYCPEAHGMDTESLQTRHAPRGRGEHAGAENLMVRSGKARAGRLLDGREWSEFPA